MNEHDSEKIAGLLLGEGYQPTTEMQEATIILINTCNIREKADQKFYSEIGRLADLKQKRPELIIGVGGCIAQQEGRTILSRMPHVDLVFGTEGFKRLPVLLRTVSKGGGKVIDTDLTPSPEDGSAPVLRKDKVKAWVSIMYGCDNYCTYCVVPYTRGRERSRPPQEILSEVRFLAEEGYKEINLIGQNVNSYGKGLRDYIDFPGLLGLINDISGLERIRFVTSHPKDLSDTLIIAMAELSKVCEHIHLPLQSGSDGILNRMKREYTFSEYKVKVEKLRNLIPDISITTDIIVGFPGEGDKDFEDTLKALNEIEYDSIFAFKYSRRPNTVASNFEDQIGDEIKQERLQTLLDLQKVIGERRNRAYLGRVVEVLVEGGSKKDPDKLTGRTRTNKVVNFNGDKRYVGSLLNVKIKEVRPNCLEGEVSN